MASLESVRSFAKSWQQQERPLHMLINNAGIFSMGGALASVYYKVSLLYLWIVFGGHRSLCKHELPATS